MLAEGQLWCKTPLIYSPHLSNHLGPDYAIYLKLENLQPQHSFKSRGISYFIKNQVETHGPGLHVVCPSSGNGGLAAAAACQALGVSCTIFLPEGISSHTVQYFETLGAKVVVSGAIYPDALAAAKACVAADKNSVLVSTYDDESVWEGHSSIVEEIKNDLPQKPDAIICSVGGGGLLGGIILGCKHAGWDDVPIIGVETHGSNCFFESMAANRGEAFGNPDNVTLRMDTAHNVKIAQLHKLASQAASLGASEAAAGVVSMGLKRVGGIQTLTIPDEMGMQALLSFCDDHKMIVELACSTALALAYSPQLMSHIIPPIQSRKRHVVFVVCGGFKVSTGDIGALAQALANDQSEAWEVKLGQGQRLLVPRCQ